jgi:hypothetical protein
MCGRDIDIPNVHRLTMRTFARQEARLMDCAMRLSKWQRGGAEALVDACAVLSWVWVLRARDRYPFSLVWATPNN